MTEINSATDNPMVFESVFQKCKKKKGLMLSLLVFLFWKVFVGSDEIVEGEMKQESLHDEEHCEFFYV